MSKRYSGRFCHPDDCPHTKLGATHFVGRYLGLKENEDFGTFRAVFEVDEREPYNRAFIDIINEIRLCVLKQVERVWRGFSSSEDYKRNSDWNLWIWAPIHCDMGDVDEDVLMPLRIRNSTFFRFDDDTKYDSGVNLEVTRCACGHYDEYRSFEKETVRGQLLKLCTELRGTVFKGAVLKVISGASRRDKKQIKLELLELDCPDLRNKDAAGILQKILQFSDQAYPPKRLVGKVFRAADGALCITAQAESIPPADTGVFRITSVDLRPVESEEFEFRMNIKVESISPNGRKMATQKTRRK